MGALGKEGHLHLQRRGDVTVGTHVAQQDFDVPEDKTVAMQWKRTDNKNPSVP